MSNAPKMGMLADIRDSTAYEVQVIFLSDDAHRSPALLNVLKAQDVQIVEHTGIMCGRIIL